MAHDSSRAPFVLASRSVDATGRSEYRVAQPWAGDGRLLSSLGVVAFVSGFSALLYEIAWQRLLTLYSGVGSASLILIVSVYMLGLGAGALLGGRLSARTGRPGMRPLATDVDRAPPATSS